MQKTELTAALHGIDNSLRALQKNINEHSGTHITQHKIKESAKAIATKWFDLIEKQLPFYKILDDQIKKYHQHFVTLLQISLKSTRKVTYTKTIKEIRAKLTTEIIIPVYKFSPEIHNFNQLDVILDSLTEEEKPLMKEALDCAISGYLRASVVLGWAAAIDRMHKRIAVMGFDTFNKKTEEMSNINDGRYKRFKKKFYVHNMAEFQATVLDNDLLWVLEYCETIDNNQHERLMTCFVMRNTSAHPSSTPIKPENVTSFYADLKSIIFDNEKFKLPATK